MARSTWRPRGGGTTRTGCARWRRSGNAARPRIITPNVPSTYPEYTPNVPSTYPACTLNVPRMYPEYTPHVP
eukprot:1195570-Prorocentrum_minimum.AAC.3